jgi:hypothetical protein
LTYSEVPVRARRAEDIQVGPDRRPAADLVGQRVADDVHEGVLGGDDEPSRHGGLVLLKAGIVTPTDYQMSSYTTNVAENKQLRAIVAKRLSRLTEVTTHLETEDESIEGYVQRKNILVVAETEDLDVSGGKPIKERPGIGPNATGFPGLGLDGWFSFR